MQISGANLLASQQAMPAAKPAAPGFAPLLQKAAGFTPRDLTASQPAQASGRSASRGKAGRAGRPGMHIDIKI